MPILLTEFVLTFGFILIALLDLLIKNNKKVILLSTLFFILLLAIVKLSFQFTVSTSLYSVIKITGLEHFAELLCLFAGVLYTIQLWINPVASKSLAEQLLMLLSSLIGMMVLIKSNNLLTAFIGIEIISVSAYLFVAFALTKLSAKASFDYFVFGATVSGIMLFGISMLYGFRGTVFYEDLFAVPSESTLMTIALLFVLTGFLFKLASIPYHFWIPSVYEATPIEAITFMSVAPKVAVISVLMQLYITPLCQSFPLFLPIVGIISILVGNLGALKQTNYRVLLGYASISQISILLLPIPFPTSQTNVHLYFYLTIYLLSNYAIFVFCNAISRNYNSDNISNWIGGRYNFILSIVLVFLVINLTGLPPTAGFISKFLVFLDIFQNISSFSIDSPYVIILLIAILSTLLSLIYYIKIPYYVLFKKSVIVKKELVFSISEKIFIVFLTLPLIIFFIKFNWLIEFINFVLNLSLSR